MEQKDQSIPEPGIASVVQVPTQALSKAKGDPALQNLDEMVKAEFRDVIGAMPEKHPPRKEGSAFREAVIKLVKDHKPFRLRNFALTSNSLQALKAIIDEFLDCGWLAHSDSEWGSPVFIAPKKDQRILATHGGLQAIEPHERDGLVWHPPDQRHFARPSAETRAQCAGFEAWLPPDEVGGTIAGLHDNVKDKTDGAGTPVNRSQVAQETAHAAQHTERENW